MTSSDKCMTVTNVEFTDWKTGLFSKENHVTALQEIFNVKRCVVYETAIVFPCLLYAIVAQQ